MPKRDSDVQSEASEVPQQLSKKARKEARKALSGGEAAVDSAASRAAATADFLAKREAAEAAAAEKRAAKQAEKEARQEAERARSHAKKQQQQQQQAAKRSNGSRSTSSSKFNTYDGGAGTAGGTIKPGDWPCLHCGANVFASKDACFRCGVRKGEHGTGEPPFDRGGGGGGGGSKKVSAAPDSGFVDINATCKECGASFIVTAGAQQFMKDKGFGVLVRTRCKACTSAKKERFGERYGAGGKNGGGGGGGESVAGPARCYVCGEPGHTSSTCPMAPKAGGCFHCGEVGHLARNCPKASAGSCFRCGQLGHMSKDCTAPAKDKGRAWS